MSFEPIFHLNVTHRERVPSDSSVEDETKGFMETANEIRQHIQEFQNQELQLKFFRNRPDILKPRKSRTVGWDLFTLPDFHCIIPSGESRLIPLGVSFAFPNGYYGQLCSLTSIAFQKSIYVQGGIIDPEYDGDVHVLLHNFGKFPFHVNANTKICQMVLLRYSTLGEMEEVSSMKNLRNSLFRY